MDGADTPPPGFPRLAPEVLLRQEPWDWIALLMLWCTREAARCLLVLGLIPPILVGQADENLLSRLDTPSELFESLLSPLILLALAILLRLEVSIVALVIAFPFHAADTFDASRTPVRSLYMRTYDLFMLASGKKTLRWTWAVRRSAANRLGTLGSGLELTGRVLSWMVPVCAVIVLVVAVVVY